MQTVRLIMFLILLSFVFQTIIASSENVSYCIIDGEAKVTLITQNNLYELFIEINVTGDDINLGSIKITVLLDGSINITDFFQITINTTNSKLIIHLKPINPLARLEPTKYHLIAVNDGNISIKAVIYQENPPKICSKTGEVNNTTLPENTSLQETGSYEKSEGDQSTNTLLPEPQPNTGKEASLKNVLTVIIILLLLVGVGISMVAEYGKSSPRSD